MNNRAKVEDAEGQLIICMGVPRWHGTSAIENVGTQERNTYMYSNERCLCNTLIQPGMHAY